MRFHSKAHLKQIHLDVIVISIWTLAYSITDDISSLSVCSMFIVKYWK
jgi:hypothetical protein